MSDYYKKYAATLKIQITIPIFAENLEDAQIQARHICHEKALNEIPFDSDIDNMICCFVNEDE